MLINPWGSGLFKNRENSTLARKIETMADDKAAKQKALQLTLDKLDKTYGKGSVMRLGDSAIEEVESISSGSIGLDIALGVGGYPKGRVIEIYGPESSGKTTLTIHAIAECQKKGGIAAFIDAEHALDIQYAAKLGVNITRKPGPMKHGTRVIAFCEDPDGYKVELNEPIKV